MNKGKIVRKVYLLLFLVLFSCDHGNYVSLEEGYAYWKQPVEGVLSIPISGHTMEYRKIYINTIAEGVSVSENGKRLEYPEGSVILKENLSDPAGQPMALTIMVKDEDHKLARGGWVWITKNPQTGEENIITSRFCFSCHVFANETHPYGDKNLKEQFRDYIFYPYLPE